MPIQLAENRYGKSRVRLMKISRGENGHSVADWNVEVWLTGDFSECFINGDNSRILPTDTMKNTVYSLARASIATSPEAFAIELTTHFVASNPYAEQAQVNIRSVPWQHIKTSGHTHPAAFTHAEDRCDTTTVTNTRASGLQVKSGFENQWLLKTANSGFTGYVKDRLTTLKETNDRLLGTLATVSWTYQNASLDYSACRDQTLTALLNAFAEHNSLSVQQTLYAMAQAALEHVPDITEIHLSMPNKHCNLVDLTPFGQDNPNMIFVPTDEPHGSIEATVRRSGRAE